MTARVALGKRSWCGSFVAFRILILAAYALDRAADALRRAARWAL